MKFKLYLSILLFSSVNYILPQTIIYSGQIGSFNSAKSFSINSLGYIYVSDVSSNEIIKLDTLGKVIKSIGGYGWKESSFDYPIDVFAAPLNIYVADKNNNRIQLFDKDLNFLSYFSTQDSDDDRIKFRYPLSSAISSQGDIFILDSDNRRILKFNQRWEFQTSIGNYEAGPFALVNPKHFAITSNTKVLVADSQNLIMFDQFGNGIKKIQLPFEPVNINATFQTICVNDKSQIAYFADSDLESNNFNPTIFKPKLEDDIEDSFLYNSKIYLLTKSTILIYKIVQSN
ncbi:MAG: NHL repeat-containing protein [Ignavibacteriales bacterium]|nr:NHL repeat-containing protein [Ignavibacteriales bacterium]